MKRIKMGDSVIQMPDEAFDHLAQQLGSPELAAAAIRAARDPEYHRKAMAAVGAGNWPKELLQVTRAMAGMGKAPMAPVTPPENPYQALQALMPGGY